MKIADVLALKHAIYPIITESAKLRLSVNLDRKTLNARLWMATMISFDKSLIKEKGEKLVLPEICAQMCRWHSELPVSRPGMDVTRTFRRPLVRSRTWRFSHAETDEEIGDFQHQVILTDYRAVRLPDELSFCTKLKLLNFSYCSYFGLPRSW